DSPAGRYLAARGVAPADFNSYGSRRGNDEVMTRGTFGNIRLRNRLAPGTEGGWTTLLPEGTVTPIFDAAESYRSRGIPALVLAGRDYGMGSSRDWAAKGTALLGVRAVVAESYERIHRANLAGMGILPLQFLDGESAASHGLTGREVFTVLVDDRLAAGQEVEIRAEAEDGTVRGLRVRCRLDTPGEVASYRHGGLLPAALRRVAG
ncbi:MAG: aconitate hydratase, partial [Deltaproteobacteria bacterium]|nr:aconitate hydratase [Deltaproteobacteria bacterium]